METKINKVNYYKLLLNDLKSKYQSSIAELAVTQEKIKQYAETIDSLEDAIERMEE